MTFENHCRIGRVKMKSGGAHLHLIPKNREEVSVFRYLDGMVTVRSNSGFLSVEHALFLLNRAKCEIDEHTMGWKTDQ